MSKLMRTLALSLGLIGTLGAQDSATHAKPSVAPPAQLEADTEESSDTASTDDRLAEARAELAELVALINGAPTDEAWPHWSMGLRDTPKTAQLSAEKHPVVQASARLVLFESRFGVRAQALPGWTELSKASTAALSVFVIRTVDREQSSPAMVWTRAFLEFAAGDPGAARTTLLGDHPRLSGGDCWFHESEGRYWTAAARAVVLDLIGNTEAALPWYHAAAFWYWDDLSGALNFGHHRVVCDLVLARYAEHLMALDAADGAERVLESLARNWAGTLGQRFAEHIVRPKLPSDHRGFANLFALKLKKNSADGNWRDPTGVLFLLGNPSTPKRSRVLGGTVAYEAPPEATLINPLNDVLAVGPDDSRLKALTEKLATDSSLFSNRGHLTRSAGW
ncbi:MAG: hypothetical protein DHS20C15_14360 [Planctomycetota bacterium]|nr:MAG: hypothetical protein DHS20C15_14360 [Planctomycetota bacterium]